MFRISYSYLGRDTDRSEIILRNFGTPHVLPLYVPDKLLAREISYQTLVDGLTKTLKEAKKSLCLSFPIQCGVYSLHDFKHASLEIDNITCLNLATRSGKQFAPN